MIIDPPQPYQAIVAGGYDPGSEVYVTIGEIQQNVKTPLAVRERPTGRFYVLLQKPLKNSGLRPMIVTPVGALVGAPVGPPGARGRRQMGALVPVEAYGGGGLRDGI